MAGPGLPGLPPPGFADAESTSRGLPGLPAPGFSSQLNRPEPVDYAAPNPESFWGTLKDWALTRPSGERIDPAKATAGLALQPLNALTLGFGDEITAGGATLVDALTGGGPGYDARLEQARNALDTTREESPITSTLLSLAGALKLPYQSKVGQVEGFVPKVKQLGKEGFALGSLYGFGEGEGGALERAEDAIQSGLTSAGITAGIGAPFAGASALTARYADKLDDAGKGLIRKSMGARQSDYAKSAKDLGIFDVADDQIESATKKALDSLSESGVLGKDKSPSKMLVNSLKEQKKITSSIATIIGKADEAGVRAHPDFTRTIDYIAKGRLPADKVDDYLRQVQDLSDAIRREGKGSLAYLQQQKIAVGDKWDPTDKAVSGFWRAVYTDIKNAIEKKVPAVKGLNKELEKFKLVDPILKRGLATNETQTLPQKAVQALRTSGGTLTTPTLIGGTVGGTLGGPLGMVAGGALTAAASPAGQFALGKGVRSLAGNSAALTSPIKKLPNVVSQISNQVQRVGTQQKESLRQSELSSRDITPRNTRYSNDFIDSAIDRAEAKQEGRYMPEDTKEVVKRPPGFKGALEETLEHEGGIADVKGDRGGLTNKGITQSTYNRWLRKQGKDTKSVRNIKDDEIEKIYHDEYWKKSKADKLPDAISKIHFDTAVHSGPTQAIKLLQKALGVEADGRFGPNTVAALKDADPQRLGKKYISLRRAYLERLARNNPTQAKFLKGWLARVEKLEQRYV